MSGTRSPSRVAPAIKPGTRPVLLIVSHGERGGGRNDRFAHGLVARLREHAGFADVQACFLSKEPSLKKVSAALPPGPVVIYPLFMADGYFVNKAIPHQLSESGIGGAADEDAITVLRPLGLHPGLPELVIRLALETAEGAGVDAGAHQLLLVAHGSKHEPASREVTEDLATKLRERDRFAGVSVSFLEEPPFVSEQLAAITRPVIVVGLFAGQGMHGAVDVPEAIAGSQRDDVLLAAPLTEGNGLAELVCDQLASGTDTRKPGILVDHFDP